MNQTQTKLLIHEKREAIKKIRKQLETLDIGNEIHVIMETTGFTHQNLADIINCDRSNIAKICKRKNNINLVQLILISTALEYNFFEKICDLLEVGQNNNLPIKHVADNISITERRICQTNQTPTILFHQKEV